MRFHCLFNSLLVGAFIFLYGTNSSYAQPPWTPNLSQLQGQLQFFQSMLARHPTFMTQNMRFRRNVLEVFRNLEKVRHDLGEDAASWEVTAAPVLSSEYVFAEEWSYDTSVVEGIKGILFDDLKQLSHLYSQEFTSASDVFRSFREPHRVQNSKILLRLLPLLFDVNGKPMIEKLDEVGISTVRSTIEALDVYSLENIYLDGFQRHYRTLVKSIAKETGINEIKGALQEVTSEFLNKKIREEALRTRIPRLQDGSLAEVRAVSVERVTSATFAILRGYFGGDCSFLSIPYFPLVKGTRVYWIRKSLSAKGQPIGYAFVAPVVIDGKTYPYVITQNGIKLSQSDANRVLHLISRDWNTDGTVVLPDFNSPDNQWVVNTFPIRAAMSEGDGKAVIVELPSGWKVATAARDLSPTNYQNYYDVEKIKKARIVKLKPNSKDRYFSETIPPPYQLVPDPTHTPLFERAILGGSVLGGVSDEERKEVAEALGLSDSELKAGEEMYKLSFANPLTISRMQELNQAIGFTVKHVLKLETYTTIGSLHKLSTENPDLLKPEEWAELWTKAAARADVHYFEERDALGAGRGSNLRMRSFVPPQYIQESAMGYLNSKYIEDVKFALEQLEKVQNIRPNIREKLLAVYEPKGISQIPDGYKLEFMRVLAKMNPSSLKIQSLILKDIEERWRVVREDGKEKTVGHAIYDEVLSKITLNPGLEPALIALADTKSHSDHNGFIASSAQTLLSKLETPSEPAMLKLVTALSSDNSMARLAAAQKLLALRPRSEAVLEGAVNALVYASHLQRPEIIGPITQLLLELHEASPIIAETIFEKMGSFRKIVLEHLAPIILQEAGKHADFQLMLVKGIEYGWPEDKFEVVYLMSQLHPTELGVQIKLLDVFRRSYEKLTINKQVHLLQNQIFEDILYSMTVHPGLESELLKKVNLSGDIWKYNQEATAYLLGKLAHPSVDAQTYMASNLYYPSYFVLDSILTSFEKTPPKTAELKAKLEHARVQNYIPDQAKLRFQRILEPSAAHPGKCTVYETQ